MYVCVYIDIGRAVEPGDVRARGAAGEGGRGPRANNDTNTNES